MKPLHRAIASARAGKLSDVLAALVEQWRVEPAGEVAQAIAALGEAIRTTPEGLRDAPDAWERSAPTATAADLPALLETWLDAYPARATARLALLPRDPRVDEHLVGLIETMHERAPLPARLRREVGEAFWLAVLARLAALRDPALVARLGAAKLDRDAALEKLVKAKRRPLLAKLRKVRKPPAAPAALAKLLPAIEAARGGRHDLAALEAAVYAAPDDDAPRLVYADALLERGDSRGELIALQCAGVTTDAQRERERALLAAHGRRWLGPLAKVVMPGYRFERGFLGACVVDPEKMAAADALDEHPLWSTVRELDARPAIALAPHLRALRVLTLQGDGGFGWRELFGGAPRPIEVLHYDGPRYVQSYDGKGYYRVIDTDEVGALAHATALPQLRSLTLNFQLELALDKLRKAPLLAQLDELILERSRYLDGLQLRNAVDLTPMLRRLLACPPVPRIVLRLGDGATTTELVYAAGRAKLAVGTLGLGVHDEHVEADALRLIAALPRKVPIEVSIPPEVGEATALGIQTAASSSSRRRR